MPRGTTSTRRSRSQAETATTARERADRDPRCCPDHPIPACVLDVLPVGGDDERSPTCDGAEQPRRNEKVRVHDIGPKAVRRASDVERERARAGRGRRGGRRRLAPARGPEPRARARASRRTSRGPARRARGTSARRAGSARTEPMRSRHPAHQAWLNARRRCPRARAAWRRSHRSCSAREGLRGVGGAGCRCRARSRGPVRARPPRPRRCARRGRGRCARRCRCSPSGSRRWSSTRSSAAWVKRLTPTTTRVAGLELGLEAVGRLLDLALHEACLDRRDRAAQLVDALDQLARAVARAPSVSASM